MTRFTLQTFGTILSLILAFIAIKVGQNNHVLETLSPLRDLFEFSLTISAIILFIVTGFSYYNSRIESEGSGQYLLYMGLGIVHILLGPMAVIIAGMKIDFGQYWWAVLIGLVLLIIYGNGYKDARN
jgi:hypothetical protein